MDGVEVMSKDIKYTDKDLLSILDSNLHLINLSIASLEKRLDFLRSEKVEIERLISILDQRIKQQSSVSTDNAESNHTIVILDELEDDEND